MMAPSRVLNQRMVSGSRWMMRRMRQELLFLHHRNHRKERPVRREVLPGRRDTLFAQEIAQRAALGCLIRNQKKASILLADPVPALLASPSQLLRRAHGSSLSSPLA